MRLLQTVSGTYLEYRFIYVSYSFILPLVAQRNIAANQNAANQAAGAVGMMHATTHTRHRPIPSSNSLSRASLSRRGERSVYSNDERCSLPRCRWLPKPLKRHQHERRCDGECRHDTADDQCRFSIQCYRLDSLQCPWRCTSSSTIPPARHSTSAGCHSSGSGPHPIAFPIPQGSMYIFLENTRI